MFVSLEKQTFRILKNFYNITVTLVTFKYLNNINIIISTLWEENRGYVFGYDSYDSYVFWGNNYATVLNKRRDYEFYKIKNNFNL